MRKLITALTVLVGLATVACEPVAEDPAPVQGAGTKGGESGKTSKAAAPPIKLTAKRIPYRAAEFATGGPYSCVKATIVNQTEGTLSVDAWSFAITGTDDVKRKAVVGAAVGEFDSLTLAPKEKASGTVCAETKVPAKTLAFTDGLSGQARAAVAS
jgi:hypothetical protein